MKGSFEAFGETFQSLAELSRHPKCVVSYNTLYRRLRRSKGWTVEEAASMEKLPKGVTLSTKEGLKVFGKIFPSLRVLSEDPRCVVGYYALVRRVADGWPVEKAATLSSTGELIEIFGERFGSYGELAKHPKCIVSYELLVQRIHKLGWDLERAATTPGKKYNRKKSPKR